MAMQLMVSDSGEEKGSKVRPPMRGFLGQQMWEVGGKEGQSWTAGGEWANFGPTEEALRGGNWAQHGSSSKEDWSHDWSHTCESHDLNGDDWAQFHSDSSRRADASDGWQDFACSTSRDVSGNRSSLFNTSAKLGSDLDSTQSKLRSVSLPLFQERQTSPNVASLTESSRTVLRETFHASSGFHQDGDTAVSLASIQSLVNQSFWLCLAGRACLPEHLSWSHNASEGRLFGVLFSDETCTLATTSSGTGSPAEVRGRGEGIGGGDDDKFDWSTAPERKGSISPDLLPSLFRPKPISPVNIEFDHSKAALGLAMLSVSELHTMCVEMRTKFQRLSELLISELQQRDQLVHEMDVRNRFISAMLRVQNRRHGLGVNGSTDGLLRGRARTWTTKNREERYSGKFLQSIIPYRPPAGLHWRVSALRQLTDILQAIAEDSDTVPSLVSDYMQSEVLVSPVEEGPPQDLETALSSLSV